MDREKLKVDVTRNEPRGLGFEGGRRPGNVCDKGDEPCRKGGKG